MYVNTYKSDSNQHTKTQISPSIFPINRLVIEKQAQLFAAMIQAKRWSQLYPDAKPLNISRNMVFALNNPDCPTEVSAYYKVNHMGEEAAALMEKKMWDIAVILGMEEHFAATGTAKILPQIKVNSINIITQILMQTIGGSNPKNKKLISGSIQAKIEGITLKEYYFQPEKRLPGMVISKANLIDSTLVLLVCGMFDAHHGNIMVTPSGKIQFFDNTWNFPHSNSLIRYIYEFQPRLYPSVRSGLMWLEESFEPLSQDEREYIKNEIRKYQGKMGALNCYLNHHLQTKEIEKLPPGWFNKAELLEALQERLTLLAKAIDDPRLINLRDLTLASQPNLRFLAALNACPKTYEKYSSEKIRDHQKVMFHQMGIVDVQTNLIKMTSMGLSIDWLKTLCDDPNLSFDEVLGELIKKMQELVEREQDDYAGDIKRAQEEGTAILSQLNAQARLDLKDVPLAVTIAFYGEAAKKIPILKQFYEAKTLIIDSENAVKKEIENYPAFKPIIFIPLDVYPLKSKIIYKNMDGSIKCWDLILETKTKHPPTLGFGKDNVTYAEMYYFLNLFKHYYPHREQADSIIKYSKENKENCAFFTRGDEPGKIVLNKIDAIKNLETQLSFSQIPDRPIVLKSDKEEMFYNIHQLMLKVIEEGFAFYHNFPAYT